MFKRFVYVLLISLSFTACTVSKQKQEDATKIPDHTAQHHAPATLDTPHPSPTAASPTPLSTASPTITPSAEVQLDPTAEEHQIVNDFIETVKLRDAQLLLDFMQLYSKDIAERHGAEASFYNTFFDYLFIDLNYDFSHLSFTVQSYNEYRNDYHYAIYNTFTNKPIGLVASVNEEFQLYWAYLFYVPYTKLMISDYVAYIQVEDIESLTSIMTVDDLLYDNVKSEQIIAQYKQYFGTLDDLQFEYSGDFNFTIYNSDNKRHMLSIVYGDGLMGIVDELAPRP